METNCESNVDGDGPPLPPEPSDKDGNGQDEQRQPAAAEKEGQEESDKKLAPGNGKESEDDTSGKYAGRTHGVVWFAVDMCNADNEAKESKSRSQKPVRRRRSTIRDLISQGVIQIPTVETIDEENIMVIAPSDRVRNLLNLTNQDLEKPAPTQMFTELKVLTIVDNTIEWREMARWVRYEETVEEGGDRWSKPHVATLTLHSLFELRSCFLKGVVILDLSATGFEQLIDVLLEAWKDEYELADDVLDDVRQALRCRHRHQYENTKSLKDGMPSGHSFLKGVRSIADIGRSLSHARVLGSNDSSANQGSNLLSVPDGSSGQSSRLGLSSSGGQISPPTKSASSKTSDHHAEGNYHLYKKLSRDAQAANVLVGELSTLTCRISGFVRLETAHLFEKLTEVPVPTRFVFILLGPPGSLAKFREVGRAMSTVMSDEIFTDVAYKATEKVNFLDAIDEFMEQVIVLPPGEWDPSIRIEPPPSVPSQESRKLLSTEQRLNGSGGDHEEEEKEILERSGRYFGGLINDVKRKIKFYRSDFTDGLNLQCVAAFLYMYFAMLAPIVTFGGLLEEATDRNLAAMENLFSGAVCGLMYSLFSGQPLTMIGSTGPVLIFEHLVYDGCTSMGLDFLGVRFWINMWAGIILMVIVALDLSCWVSYITRFTEECFAVLISFIFIYESIAKLSSIYNHRRVILWNPTIDSANLSCSCVSQNSTDLKRLITFGKRHGENVSSWLQGDANHTSVDWANMPLDYCRAAGGVLQGNGCYQMLDVFLASMVLLFGTFLLATALKKARNSSYFPSRVRCIISDFAVILSITLMILLDYFMGLDTPKLYVPDQFKPTNEGRGWLVHPLVGASVWWVPIVTFIPAALLCILLFMDHEITVVIVNRRENKLKKGSGYHLDMFMISLVCFITGVFGLPIFVAATVMSISHVNALKKLSECQAPGEKPKFIGVCEQRVTGIFVFLFIGLSVLMTSVLKHIPMPVLYGVFLYMGISSLASVQMIDRLLLFLMPMKYQPDNFYLRRVPIRRVHLFTIIQVSCFILLCIIKEIKSTSMGFPILLVILVAVRKGMELIFTKKELDYLDDKMPNINLPCLKRIRLFKFKKSEHTEVNAVKLEQGGDSANAVVRLSEPEDVQIPLSSGMVMSIPLKSLNRTVSEERELSLSEEVVRTGLWKHIASSVDIAKHKDNAKRKQGDEKLSISPDAPGLTEKDDDDTEAITISFKRRDKAEAEYKPLLRGDVNKHDSVQPT